MALKLLALHGYTLNAEAMRGELAALAAALDGSVELVYLDAPHVCSPASVTRLYGEKPPAQALPHLTWWNASDDGAMYQGWSRTRDLLAASLEAASSCGARVGVLGFSQGAMVAATVAALASRGELPRIEVAILIAGAVPRARELLPYFAAPIEVPSLHVWGLRDDVSGASAPALAERFSPTQREIVTWRGPHVIPTRGVGGDAIIAVARRHA